MKNKILSVLLFVFILIIAMELASADITTIKPNVAYPGDDIRLRITPDRRAGFYNIIYVMQDLEVVDLISVPCSTICKKRQTIYYPVPQDFLGEYYFATFDYKINDYEYDYFNVIEPGGATSGNLEIQYIQNIDGINGIINPEQGKNADIETEIRLRVRNCEDYIVRAFMCNSSILNCDSQTYSFELPITLDRINGRRCFWGYQGEDYFPFYQPSDEWKLFVKSGVLEDSEDFSYTSLVAINYSSYINFGSLNARVWNIGVPEQGIDLINFGNVPMMLEWNSSGFDCVSGECIGDSWPTFYNGENTFQIDDDTFFMEEQTGEPETGIPPSFITDYELNYFPNTELAVCISNECNDNIGEKIRTFYNLKLPDIKRGVYQGDIKITSSPPLDVGY